MEEIKVWAQMFFKDGSVSQGQRIPAQWLDEGFEEQIEIVANDILDDLNRETGYLLIWGAGNLEMYLIGEEE